MTDRLLYEKLSAVLLSSDQKKVYQTISYIRRKLTRKKSAVEKLCTAGVIGHLLFLLQQHLTRIQSVATEADVRSFIVCQLDGMLSILGNVCMEHCARSSVLQNDGIPVLVEILQTDQLDAANRNRAVRLIANLSLDPHICHLMNSRSVPAIIVKLLQKTEDGKEFQLTCCRAIRLLCHTHGHSAHLAAEADLNYVVTLITSADEELSHCALRTIAEISNSCCEDFARKVVSAHCLEHIVMLVSHGDAIVSQNALTILLNLCFHSNARPPLGNAGCVLLFLKILRYDDHACANQTRCLNGLCLMCKEVVNRVKLREHGFLRTAVDILSGDSFSIVHERLISALVCFVYDDSSIDLLLQYNTITVLLKHLETYASFTTWSMKDIWDISGLAKTFKPQGHKRVRSAGPDGALSTNPKKIKHEFHDAPYKDSHSSQTMTSWFRTRAMEIEMQIDSTETKTICPDLCHSNSTEQNPVKSISYSIYSPSYVAESDWKLDDFTGDVTCKTDFSSSRFQSYSPLSTSSYNSTDSSPPQYQTAGDWSPGNFVPTSPGYYGSPPSPSSPGLSPESSSGASPRHMASGSDITGAKWSSSEDESDNDNDNGDDDIKRKNHSQSCGGSIINKSINSCSQMDIDNNLHSATQALQTTDTLSDARRYAPDSRQTDNSNMNLDIQIDHPTTDSAPLVLPERGTCNREIGEQIKAEVDDCIIDNPGCEGITEKTSHSDQLSIVSYGSHTSWKKRATEMNILVLLSRFSQVKDPSKCFTSVGCFETLLSYISRVQQPLNRCFRILSRLVHNPYCLEILIDTLAAAAIYKTFLSKNPAISNLSRPFSECARMESCVFDNGISESNNTGVLCNNPVLSDCTGENVDGDDIFDNITSESVHPKPRCRSVSVDTSAISSHFLTMSDTEVGQLLLNDFSFVIESTYGQGTVEHLWIRGSDDMKVKIALSLPFLCRIPSVQTKLLIDLGALDLLIDLLSITRATTVFSLVVIELTYLAQTILKSTANAVDLLTPALKFAKFPNPGSEIPSDQPACMLVGDSRFESRDEDKFSTDLSKLCVVSVNDVGYNTAMHSGSIFASCPFLATVAEHNVVFVTDDGSRYSACKETLISRSAVFQAMLIGSYIEAKQNEIRIKHTTSKAFEYLLHYLHDCCYCNCDIISAIAVVLTDSSNEYQLLERSEHQLETCLELLKLTDQYLLIDLHTFIQAVLYASFFTLPRIPQIFPVASLYNCPDLAFACIIFMLLSINDDQRRSDTFREMIRRSGIKGIQETISKLFYVSINSAQK